MKHVKTNALAAAVALTLAAPLATTANAAGSIEDSKATLQLRNFYFNRDFRSTPATGQSKAEE
tara:strand:+ start:41124 stop:41312 length:189 start_codon:yes stop_codon:yes gene_type:complete